MPKKPRKVLAKKFEEKVMVVKRADIFSNGIWHGIKAGNIKKYVSVINTKHKFLPRGEVEEDPRWQQIIPYLIFQHKDRIFVMRRKGTHTDTRLANKYSLGIGGHINKSDIGSARVNSWAKREFEEEVGYKGKYKMEFVGLINDDSNEVGMVHVGLVIKIKGNSDAISVKDEHKSGELMQLSQVSKHYKNMETWSQIIYDFLMPKKKQLPKSNNVSGVLPDWIIEKYIREKIISIEGLNKKWEQQIDQVSIDFHLGTNIKLFKSGTYRFVDTRRGLPADAMEEVILHDGDPFILEPGSFAIASTKEILKLPKDILGRLEGKSSLARLGILVHSTAARFDPGWNGAPVLELGNLGPKPAVLYAGMPICAFTFEKLAAPVRMAYEGSRSDRYSGSKVAVASKIDSALRSSPRVTRLRAYEKHGKR